MRRSISFTKIFAYCDCQTEQSNSSLGVHCLYSNTQKRQQIGSVISRLDLGLPSSQNFPVWLPKSSCKIFTRIVLSVFENLNLRQIEIHFGLTHLQSYLEAEWLGVIVWSWPDPQMRDLSLLSRSEIFYWPNFWELSVTFVTVPWPVNPFSPWRQRFWEDGCLGGIGFTGQEIKSSIGNSRTNPITGVQSCSLQPLKSSEQL